VVHLALLDLPFLSSVAAAVGVAAAAGRTTMTMTTMMMRRRTMTRMGTLVGRKTRRSEVPLPH